MSNFVDDLTTLPYPKTDDVPLSGGDDATKFVTASDWNKICQAEVDLRGSVLNAHADRLTQGTLPSARIADGSITNAKLVNTAVTPGAYTNVSATVDQQGRITAMSSGSAGLGDEINVKDYGAVGDWNPITQTGTDDRAAIISALAAAIAAGKGLVFPPGNYKISKVIPIVGARGLKIRASAFVSIYYPSDDLTLIPDAAIYPFSYGVVRSGLFIKNSRDVSIDNITFVGGSTQELSNAHVGVGIYATRTVGFRGLDCRGLNGATLFAQENARNTTQTISTFTSIAVSAGVVTFTDTDSLFHPGMVGAQITVNNATNPVNNGVFDILTYISADAITYANTSAVAETIGTSSALWSVNDGDNDTKLTNCRWDNCRSTSFTGNGGVFENCTFNRPITKDLTGIPDAFSISGTTVTLIDGSGTWTSSVTGGYIKIQGSTSPGNDGIFPITSAVAKSGSAPATLTYENASGVTELAPLTSSIWWIPGGERNGIGAGATAIANTNGIVTFTASAPIFRADDVNKTLCLTDATSQANNGNHVISRYVSSTVVEYINSIAVSETYAKIFTIDGYDSTKGDSSVGPAITSTSTSVSANTLTDTAATGFSTPVVLNAYAGRYLTDSTGRQWRILSNTTTAFTLVAGGATPAAGAYTVSAGATHGSSHGIYYFAGRERCKVLNCVFRGVRTTGVKISGSSLPIRAMEVSGCVFDECGAAIIAGADDAQEHTGFNFHHNHIQDCSNGRSGWNDQLGIGVLGARDVQVTNNAFHVTHDCVAAVVNTNSVGGYFGIYAARYVAGVSQPLEDALIDHNTFTIDTLNCDPNRIAQAAIHGERIGQRARWGSGGTLAKSGSVMTLTDGSAKFNQTILGDSLQIVFAPDGGNNNAIAFETKITDFVVATVPSQTTLTFVNAGGVGGNVSAGTYRIKPKTGTGGRRGGICSISHNTIAGYGATGVELQSCTAPQIVGNVFNGMAVAIREIGSVAPHIAKNVEVAAGSNSARIGLSTGTAWPIVYDNFITNGALAGGNLNSEAAATRSDMGIGVDGGGAIEHPLLGKCGRAKSTNAMAENVFAFGSDHVDGDTFFYIGTLIQYKANSPGAHQFNDLASLIALIDAIGFIDCADYGAQFAVPVATGHVRAFLNVQAATADNLYIDTINVLNETALVIPRNDSGGGEAIQYSRGEGSTGPTPTRFVAWSMQSTRLAPIVQADNAAAAALMAGGWLPDKSTKNAGCCTVFKTITVHDGTEEFTWRLP